jgi:hypothetical protein
MAANPPPMTGSMAATPPVNAPADATAPTTGAAPPN